MAHNTETPALVKVDIWASVVYMSGDCVSLRGFSWVEKRKSLENQLKDSHCNVWLWNRTTIQWLFRDFSPWSHTKRRCPGIYCTERLWGDSRDKEADLQGRSVTITARKALMFGKMLKYKGIGCVILECGASGLTVGGEITQEAKKVCDEGRENITTLTNHNSCAGPISHHYNFKILIYLHNICLLSRFENVQYIKKTNCTSNICLFGDERGDGSKRATASLSFPTARHSKLPESEGQYEQAGRAATSWELFLLVVVGGADMLAAIFHHRLVFNPPKSVSLWPHTCASSYQGLWRWNSLSASVALLQGRGALSVFISIPIPPCSD